MGTEYEIRARREALLKLVENGVPCKTYKISDLPQAEQERIAKIQPYSKIPIDMDYYYNGYAKR